MNRATVVVIVVVVVAMGGYLFLTGQEPAAPSASEQPAPTVSAPVTE